jgi:hypothetical protein
MTRRNPVPPLAPLLLIVCAAQAARAADNELSPREKQDGWVLLFDGKSPAGWLNKDKPLPAANVEGGAINPHKGGAYVTYYRQPFDNFVLGCDFKVSKGANSGIFIRTGDMADPVQTGFEIQIFDSAGKPPGKHSCGALYDAVVPKEEASKPAGEWNHIEITADKNLVKVVLNGKQVVEADLDSWTEAGKNPDGSKNKFAKALRDFPRSGHVGLQDHNAPVWFKNIKLKRLTKDEG